MTTATQKETTEFKAEVSQVLNLVIRSLYSNKEIFLRELISNSSDACEKLRFEALGNDGLYEDDSNMRIRISFDAENKTITIDDNGIGMTRDEVAETIGTIASSGTKKFVAALSGENSDNHEMIGQFGVGFYSSFIVADKVTLETRRAGADKAEGVRWESSGESSYTIESIDKAQRGTSITLHLREEEHEFADEHRLKGIISKFSDFASMPIEMLITKHEPVDSEDEENTETNEIIEWEKVNQGTAIWMKNKSEIEDKEYQEFYKHISHDYADPLKWSHNRVEGKHEFTSLLYIPSKAPYDLWDRETKHGVKLYVRRVFIMDEAEKLMPHYLRFVKGVVDSADLPLNVSRELLQHNKKIDSIKSANTKRILGLIAKMAKKEDYQAFWDEFGKVLKEGPGEDMGNKDKIAELFRFATTKSKGEAQTVSLDQYIEGMAETQDKIYYITADSYAAAKNSPHLEVFKKKEIEVLLLSDRVDEWLTSHLTEYKEKQFVSVTKGELDLGDEDKEEVKKELEKVAEEHKDFLEKLKTALAEQVKEVRVTKRLTESPACLVVDEHDMSQNLARVLQQMGQDAPVSPPILEINIEHPLLERMEKSTGDSFNDLAQILHDQALLAEGGQLKDPASFVKKLNALVLNQ